MEVSQQRERGKGSEGAAGWVRPVCSVQCAFQENSRNPGGLRPGQAGQKLEQEGGQSGSKRVRSGHAPGGSR